MYVADLHIHSRFSRACSPQLNIPNLVEWAKLKGIDLLGTGDFLHPLWLTELKANLKENGSGFMQPAGGEARQGRHNSSEIKFVLSVEISSIYSHKGKVRRVHNLVLLPSFEAADKFQKALLSRHATLASDGRPIVGISSKDLLTMALEADPKALFVPSHIWTPWFGVFGSESGYDSLQDCFEDLTDKIYAIETGLSCYDSETEVLTENGWKKFSQVNKEDKICTFNLNTEEIEYHKPQKIYRSKYQGKMYKLQTKRVDLLVTPNHNLLYAPADFHTRRPYRLKEVHALFGKSKILRKDGIWRGETPQYFTLPQVNMRHGSRFYSGFRTKQEKKFLIEPWLKFFGFWIAEGWITEGKNGHYAVCISNQNYDLMVEMKHILENFGYTVFWDKKVTNTIRVRDYQLFHYLQQFGKAADKYIPAEIKVLSKDLLETFFEYYIKGDGHVYGRGGKGLSATTISIKLRDDLQEIALKMGISAYYKLHNKKGKPFSSPSQKREYKQSADSWNIYFIRRNRHAIIPSEIKKYKYKEEWVNYDGMVFCVSVPNRVVYIRRNGIPIWCGNSDPAMNWRIEELDNRSIVSFSDAHSLPNLGREATVIDKSLEDGFNGLWEAFKQQKIAGTIEFYPEEGKYHYTGHRNCGVKLNPDEEIKNGIICPKCKKGLTVGVMSRVEKLATRGAEEVILNRPKYKMLVPLNQIIAEALNSAKTSQKVLNEYKKLTQNLGGEIKVLTKVDLVEISRLVGPKIAEGVDRMRQGKLVIDPGYDGVYGIVKIWPDGEQINTETPQLGLFE